MSEAIFSVTHKNLHIKNFSWLPQPDSGLSLRPACVYGVTQWCPTLCDLMDCSPPGSSAHGIPRQEYWSGLPCPPPRDLPNQGLNPSLWHCGRILYHLSPHGSPRILEWVAYPFSRRSFQPRIPTGVSCIAGRFFTSWAIGKSNFRPSQSHSHLSNRVAPDCYYLELLAEFMQSNFNMYPLPWSGDLTEGFNNPG